MGVCPVPSTLEAESEQKYVEQYALCLLHCNFSALLSCLWQLNVVVTRGSKTALPEHPQTKASSGPSSLSTGH